MGEYICMKYTDAYQQTKSWQFSWQLFLLNEALKISSPRLYVQNLNPLEAFITKEKEIRP